MEGGSLSSNSDTSHPPAFHCCGGRGGIRGGKKVLEKRKIFTRLTKVSDSDYIQPSTSADARKHRNSKYSNPSSVQVNRVTGSSFATTTFKFCMSKCKKYMNYKSS